MLHMCFSYDLQKKSIVCTRLSVSPVCVVSVGNFSSTATTLLCFHEGCILGTFKDLNSSVDQHMHTCGKWIFVTMMTNQTTHTGYSNSKVFHIHYLYSSYALLNKSGVMFINET